MPKRVIEALALASYTDEQGNPTFGFRGDTVLVHKNDLPRFDELNKPEG
jgi:hypothetical protein